MHEDIRTRTRTSIFTYTNSNKSSLHYRAVRKVCEGCVSRQGRGLATVMGSRPILVSEVGRGLGDSVMNVKVSQVPTEPQVLSHSSDRGPQVSVRGFVSLPRLPECPKRTPRSGVVCPRRYPSPTPYPWTLHRQPTRSGPSTGGDLTLTSLRPGPQPGPEDNRSSIHDSSCPLRTVPTDPGDYSDIVCLREDSRVEYV